MITHVLALMMMLDATAAPHLIAPFTSKAECMEAAEKGTKEDVRLAVIRVTV